MDCCNTNNENSNHSNRKMKGGYFKMDRKIAMWIAIAVLFLAVLFLTFKAGGNVTASAESAGTAAKSAASSYGGMVGGC